MNKLAVPMDGLSRFSLNTVETAWTNYQNIFFYEEVAGGLLQELAIIAGLNNCCDIELIKPYIANANSILEVGAGYGRVLDYLVKQELSCKISAIERGEKFCEILKSKFAMHVNIYQTDLHDFQAFEKFDIILWMWSGIADFSQHEQLPILSKLTSFLSSNGILILDTISPKIKPLSSTNTLGSHYKIQLGKETNHVYCTSSNEIKHYANELQFKKFKCQEYRTSTNRIRLLHILQK